MNEAELDAELAGLQEDWGTGTAVTEDTEAVPDYIRAYLYPAASLSDIVCCSCVKTIVAVMTVCSKCAVSTAA